MEETRNAEQVAQEFPEETRNAEQVAKEFGVFEYLQIDRMHGDPVTKMNFRLSVGYSRDATPKPKPVYFSEFRYLVHNLCEILELPNGETLHIHFTEMCYDQEFVTFMIFNAKNDLRMFVTSHSSNHNVRDFMQSLSMVGHFSVEKLK